MALDPSSRPRRLLRLRGCPPEKHGSPVALLTQRLIVEIRRLAGLALAALRALGLGLGLRSGDQGCGPRSHPLLAAPAALCDKNWIRGEDAEDKPDNGNGSRRSRDRLQFSAQITLPSKLHIAGAIFA
jgi:hypothetical protein